MKRTSIIASFVIAGIIVSLSFFLPLNKIQIFKINQKQFNNITYSQVEKEDKKEIDCLAANIYYEAGFEPFEGWVAVANVVYNRMKSGDYPETICEVVYQKIGKSYQFSWVRLKKSLTRINEKVYNDVLEFATSFYFNEEFYDDVTYGATFYHADYVNPKWKNVELSAKIGRHIFYRSTL